MSLTLRSYLADYSAEPDFSDPFGVYEGLEEDRKSHLLSRGYQIAFGKVREVIYREKELYLVHTDRLTAFDRYIGVVPCKGRLLAEIANFWFQRIDGHLPHHLISRVNGRTLAVKRLTPIKVEVVVRNYLAGSMLRAYQKGRREFCGHTLPEGLQPYRSLPTCMVTPTTKAEVFQHDEEVSPDRLIADGVCTEEQWRTVTDLALEVFSVGQEEFRQRGWILADTKYEFGLDSLTGEVTIIDEIHTPDSSRLWKEGSYFQKLDAGEDPVMFDKEIVRRYLLDQGFSGAGSVPGVPRQLMVQLAESYLDVAEALLEGQLEIEEVDPTAFLLN